MGTVLSARARGFETQTQPWPKFDVRCLACDARLGFGPCGAQQNLPLCCRLSLRSHWRVRRDDWHVHFRELGRAAGPDDSPANLHDRVYEPYGCQTSVLPAHYAPYAFANDQNVYVANLPVPAR
jgi:hypothetical protein